MAVKYFCDKCDEELKGDPPKAHQLVLNKPERLFSKDPQEALYRQHESYYDLCESCAIDFKKWIARRVRVETPCSS